MDSNKCVLHMYNVFIYNNLYKHKACNIRHINIRQ